MTAEEVATRTAFGGRRPRVPRAVLAVLVAAGLTAALAGCQTASGPVGAPRATGAAGPSITAVPKLPQLLPRVTSSLPAPPAAQTEIGRLSNQIDEALTRPGRVTPATRISQKLAAGDQLLIRWTVGAALPDPDAHERVRQDAAKILTLARASGLDFGSVLLLASGPAFVNGKKTFGPVVRAKYRRPLVLATNWTHVPLAKILNTMPDDKPAVFAPGYR